MKWFCCPMCLAKEGVKMKYDWRDRQPDFATVDMGHLPDALKECLPQVFKFLEEKNLLNKTLHEFSREEIFDLIYNSIQKLTNFQYSIESTQWSPDDNYILFSSFIDSERDTLIEMPDKPKGAKWNDPPVEISDLNYRYDSSGFRKPGEVQFFTIPINGGTPRQISNIKPEKRAGQGVWLGNDKIIFSVQTHPRTKYQIYLQVLDQLKSAKAQKISIANPPSF